MAPKSLEWYTKPTLGERLPAPPLELQAAELRALLDASPDAHILCDASGLIRSASRATETLFGYAPEELIGQPVEILIPAAHRMAHHRHSRNFVAHRQSRSMALGRTFQACRKDGTLLPVTVGLTYERFRGMPYVLASVRDARERVRIEERERQLEQRTTELQRLEAIGRVTASIVHDFNNSLAAILATADFVTQDAGSDFRWRQEMEEIASSVRRASEFTRQLLAFARGGVVSAGTVDAVAFVRDYEPTLVRLAGTGHALRFRLPDAPHFVALGASQLDQVLSNLVVNARQAMSSPGTITISVSPADETAAGPGFIEITVQDTGAGMTPETRARLFEPFFTTKQGMGGTGLGLATVYGIVTRVGGQVLVESEVGRGTSFRILLPRAADSMSAPADAVVARTA